MLPLAAVQLLLFLLLHHLHSYLQVFGGVRQTEGGSLSLLEREKKEG